MSTPQTPRLRSAFPLSPPQSGKKTRPPELSPIRRDVSIATFTASNTVATGGGPVIPLTTLDAPSQRLYVLAVYIALFAWRFYDYFSFIEDRSNSLWLFMKWTAIDGAFLYGLPGLRIPWLEWSAFTLTSLFLAHALMDAILMFRMPIPLEAWLVGLGRMMYDREIAISERRVKAASLVQNSSLILGKQIIHILPEGSATLNPDHAPYCLGNGRSSVHLPLHINQTSPKSIELLRSNLDNNEVESIVLSAKEVKRLKKEADRDMPTNDLASPRTIKISVKQTGLYRLGKVLDENNLEVQRVRSDALVVQCPSASIKPGTQHRCRGELSNFYLEVDATPPLKIRYTRTINKVDQSSVFLTWHPEDLDSPLLAQQGSGPLIKAGTDVLNVSWACNRRHQISVNETMSVSGGWQYYIDEVHDGCGNIVSYPRFDEGHSKLLRAQHLEQDFLIHERPRANFRGCTVQRPIRLARGESSILPIVLNPLGHHDTKEPRHHIVYSFSPAPDEPSVNSEDVPVRRKSATIGVDGRGPTISEPGIYALESISTDFCSGEVFEPSSCLLFNPPPPDVLISSEEIPDKCAGHSVGILANLDFIGSPPFTVYFSEQRRGGNLVHKSEQIESLRHQLAFEPKEAGHYTYTFLEISDAVYRKPRSLKDKVYRLEQDIKPTAWARFTDPNRRKPVCLDQSTSFDITFTGEGPWLLEYDLVHGKTRQKHLLNDIEAEHVTLQTPVLSKGGTYSITLSSVTDRSGCKIFLDQEAKVEVRQQEPSVGFGHVDGERKIRVLQGQKAQLPLRLSGEKPWTVDYSYQSQAEFRSKRIDSSNGFLEVNQEGTYVLQAVSDSACPGTVDSSAASFDVEWIAQPEVSLAPSSKVTRSGSKFVKQPVCEGEQDAFEILLTGNAPFQLKYEVHRKPDRGSPRTENQEVTYASNGASIKTETSLAGTYTYTVTGINDRFYDMKNQKSAPIVLQQRVNLRPTATFNNAGRTYSYCKEDDSGSEVVPVTLTGTPPFTIEIGIKHQTSSKAEVITIPDILSNRYEIQVPKSSLGLGGYSVSILRVVDGNGCQRIRDRTDRDLVHVNVVDVPTITPIEAKIDYCVGDRIAYSLSGTPPFNVFYTFEGVARKAAASSTEFRRLAERPGIFIINAISDRASTDACRARTNITKVIHQLPSVRISKGKTYVVDIHEGGEAEIIFEFGGTPPFEFTYTRSTNAARGKKSIILETKHDVSHDYVKSVRAFEEGTYEVVAIRDHYCGVSMQGQMEKGPRQKLLT